MALGFSKEKQLHKLVKEGFKGWEKAVSEKVDNDLLAIISKKRKPLKLMSKRAKAELKVWTAVKIQRIGLLAKKFGYVPCELCDEIIKSNNVFSTADPHHNDRNRRNNELDNCRILHRRCHTQVHDENIKDVPSLL